jgi:hypothetical protein
VTLVQVTEVRDEAGLVRVKADRLRDDGGILKVSVTNVLYGQVSYTGEACHFC